MRLISKRHRANIWPIYDEIRLAKKACRPQNIEATEMSVIVPLEERLKHNDRRFLEMFTEELLPYLESVPPGSALEIEAESKAGADGSTGFSSYNQAFSLDNRDVSNSSLFSYSRDIFHAFGEKRL